MLGLGRIVAIQDSTSPDPIVLSAELRARGLQHGYNLDHAEAQRTFRQAIELNPDDGRAHRLLAAIIWIQLLFQQGAVTVEDFLGEARATVEKTPPPPDLDAAFRFHIGRAQTLAERSLRANPHDVDALFQLGAAHSCFASYLATVDGRGFAAFRAARRAFSAHERALEIDARRKDAGMVIGTYRYAVSTLPVHWRLLAGVAGLGGGRERGIRLVEDAARYPSEMRTNALFTLVLVYNREHRYADAMKAIAELQQMYPGNRLLWLEAGSTLLRADDPASARAALEDGLAKLAADSRPRAFGEEARWRYVHGFYRRPAALLHVSAGLGTTFVPFRFLARPEATELVLEVERDAPASGATSRVKTGTSA